MSDRKRAAGIDNCVLDRLVDGELGEPERRALLAQLETEPDGWRRCALAFLEAQSWNDELRMLVGAATAECAQTAKTAVPRRRTGSLLSVFNWAAAVLVAFTLGWLVRGTNGWQHEGPERVAAPRVGAPANSAGSVAHSEGNLPSAEEPSESVASEDGINGDIDAARTLLATLSFPESDDETAQVQVPVYEGPEFDAAWLRDQPDVVPEYVKRQLERRGYEVRQQRRLYPFQLENGRQLVLPVDEVQVQFIGYRSF